ncbi:dihydroorotase [Acidithiobacillus sp. AMEEHan]|uniref:dihydroorotase n=1 Tax=Acidithiobacillus sp. AMEEHan TaxID=2994951 RepID=UPI0027E4DAEF|nr:dihydroorotase [Acidithiobacillus sp. AMEEHan]
MSLRRRIRNLRLIDPVSGKDHQGDLALAAGKILAVGEIPGDFQADEELDGSGLIACPAFIETQFQAHTPGSGLHGDLRSELNAAAAGGFGSVVLDPDSDPIADQPGVLCEQRAAVEAVDLLRVYLSGALTRDLRGESLSEMAALAEAGAQIFSQGRRSVADSQRLRLALSYAADFGRRVFLWPEDESLAAGGVMDEGPLSLRLGLAGRPQAAEEIGVERDLRVAGLAGAAVHFPSLSSAAAIARVAEARRGGQAVSCGVSLHHLLLSVEDIGYFNSHSKILPPLRNQKNRADLLHALANGSIQCLTSQHLPWGRETEGQTFAQAPFGIAAAEWTLPLALRLVEEGILDLLQLVRLFTTGPAAVLGLPPPSLAPGATADLCLFDSTAELRPSLAGFSRARNHPYAGWSLRGQVRYLFVDGRLRYCRATG